MWYRHTKEYCSTIKRNKVLIHATIWINVENMLNEKSQSQKDIYSMIPFISDHVKIKKHSMSFSSYQMDQPLSQGIMGP